MLARWWRERALRAQAQQVESVVRDRAIPDALWLDTLRLLPFLRWRTLAQLETLRTLTTLFLARKEFSTLHGLALTDDMAVAIAAQACLPIVELGLTWYDGFVGIVVSPDEVLAQREWMDADGIVHHAETVLTGEAMPGGPVMVSWRDAREAGRTAAAGYNVVVHEFVHVLDMCDGQAADGVPPLPDAAARHQWQAVMDQALAQHARCVEQDEDTWLDPYGAEGPEEFFAVCAEAFFVAPQAFQAQWPAVYALLAGFFHQDPAAHQH